MQAPSSPSRSRSASSEMLSVDPTKELDRRLPESCFTLVYSKTSSETDPLSPNNSLIGLSLFCSEGDGTLVGKSWRPRFTLSSVVGLMKQSLRFDERALPSRVARSVELPNLRPANVKIFSSAAGFEVKLGDLHTILGVVEAISFSESGLTVCSGIARDITLTCDLSICWVLGREKLCTAGKYMRS